MDNKYNTDTGSFDALKRGTTGSFDTVRSSSSKKPGFNFIDVFIILIIAAVITAFVLILTGGTAQTASKTEQITYTVRITGMNSDMLGLIHKGDTFKDSRNHEQIGTVIDVDEVRAVYYTAAEPANMHDGMALRAVEYLNSYEIYITVQSIASVDDNGIRYVGNYRLAVGSKLFFSTPGITSSGFCCEFSVIDAE